MTPYEEAWRWIEGHPGAGSSVGLAKLILSVWDERCCFSFRECVADLDDYRTAIAVRVLHHYARMGIEDADLVAAGRAVVRMYPDLWELAIAGHDAKTARSRELAQAGDQSVPAEATDPDA